MDGKNIKAIVTNNIRWPNGLTIDYNTDTLYFADASKDRIEECNLDGKERKVRLKLCFHIKFWKCYFRSSYVQKFELFPSNVKSVIFQEVQVLLWVRGVKGNKFSKMLSK